MDEQEIRLLQAAGLVLVRVDADTWDELEDTRRHGARFTLNFRHRVARAAKPKSLAILAVDRRNARLGIVRSRQSVSSLDTRVSFDFVDEVATATFAALLRSVESPALRSTVRRLRESDELIVPVSHQRGQALVAAVADDERNAPMLRRILAWLAGRGRVEDAVVLQHDAVRLALRAFGGDPEADELQISGPTALGGVRVMEDAAIEHDARWLPGWRMETSDLTGRAVFTRHDGHLEIYTANRRASSTPSASTSFT